MIYRKHRTKFAIGALIFMLIVASYVLTEKYINARKQVNIFCGTVGLACSQHKLTPSLMLLNDWRGFMSSIQIINLTDESSSLVSLPYMETSCGDVAISLRKPENADSSSSHISFIVGRDSESIEFYSNDSYFEMRRKYGYKAWNSNDVNWPSFMPEGEARKITSAIATKLKLPSDMVLHSLKKDEKKGIWTAIWWRLLNGYRYENDRVSVSIMGASGELIEYLKTYEGAPCATVVNISKEAALRRGWERLTKVLPSELRPQAHDLFSSRASLRIIQPNLLGRLPVLMRSHNSRLAWIVHFHFTGGIELKDAEYPTEEDLDANSKALGARERKWHAVGKPLREYDVRYDAETGSILGASFVLPSFLMKLAK